MSAAWISSSSESDDDLPSFSHIIFKKKQPGSSHNSKNNESCFKTITERLNKKSDEDISLFNSSPEKENCLELKKSSSLLQKQSKSFSGAVASDTSNLINIFKPEECYKCLSCFISISIIQLFKDSNIIKDLQLTSSASYEICESEHSIVKWECSDALSQHPEWSKINLKTSCKLLFVFEASGFCIDVNDTEEITVTHPSLTEFLKCSDLSISPIILGCIGLKKFELSLNRKLQKEYRKKVLHPQNLSEEVCTSNVSIEKIEEYFVKIYLKYNANVVPVENKTEFLLLLSQITKAIAETPLKQKQRQNHHFINSSSSLKVDSKSGDGSKAVWKQMLEQIYSVSPDISSAIVAHYPSLKSLMQAYQLCSSENGALLLSDIQIRRGFGSLQQSRRLGPELSKRIFKLFTSENGDEVV